MILRKTTTTKKKMLCCISSLVGKIWFMAAGDLIPLDLWMCWTVAQGDQKTEDETIFLSLYLHVCLSLWTDLWRKMMSQLTHWSKCVVSLVPDWLVDCLSPSMDSLLLFLLCPLDLFLGGCDSSRGLLIRMQWYLNNYTALPCVAVGGYAVICVFMHTKRHPTTIQKGRENTPRHICPPADTSFGFPVIHHIQCERHIITKAALISLHQQKR